MKHVLFVLSGFGFPAREGLHAQSAELMRQLAIRGWKISCVLRIQRNAAFDADAFRNWLGTKGDIVPIRSRLNYPSELFWCTCAALVGWRSTYVKAIEGIERKHRIEILHLEGIPLMPLVALLPGRSIVVSEVDAWSLRQSRLGSRATGLKKLFLAGYAVLSRQVERWILPKASVSHVVSNADADFLRALVPAADIRCIPVAVSVDQARIRRDGPSASKSIGIVFWGDIGVPHLRAGLVWLLVDVLPLLAQDGIGFTLKVLGRREPDIELRALAQGVEFVSWIEDVSALLSSSDVVVLPDQSGTGLKNRVLEAMALGLPVVGTSHAFEGIPVVDGQEAYTRDTAQGFFSALTEIASSLDRQRLSHAAVEFVRNKYSFDAVVDQWEKVYVAAQTPVDTGLQ